MRGSEGVDRPVIVHAVCNERADAHDGMEDVRALLPDRLSSARSSLPVGRPTEQGFTALPGISTIVACLVVNQAAYVLANRLNDDQSGGAAEDLPEQRVDGVPRDDRNEDVRHKDKKGQGLKFDLARLADY
jgi:hypothetical protein